MKHRVTYMIVILFLMGIVIGAVLAESNPLLYFYTELEGRVDTEDGKNMLKLLRTACELIKVVGIYRPLK